MSKKHSFPSRISKNNLFWLNLPTNYLRGNIRFFDKKHGLTPLENVIFLNLFKTSLFLLKNHSFLSRISKKIFSGLIFPKNTHEKIFNFWIKSIIYLGNLDFLDFFKNSLFWYKKHSFLSRISKNHLILLNLPNKYLWENISFFTETMD